MPAIIDLIAAKFKISKEDAFEEFKKTRGMPLTLGNTFICPNCGGETVLGKDGQREYRSCTPCNKREYTEFD
jgi:transcription elongation factor Elf1